MVGVVTSLGDVSALFVTSQRADSWKRVFERTLSKKVEPVEDGFLFTSGTRNGRLSENYLVKCVLHNVRHFKSPGGKLLLEADKSFTLVFVLASKQGNSKVIQDYQTAKFSDCGKVLMY